MLVMHGTWTESCTLLKKFCNNFRDMTKEYMLNCDILTCGRSQHDHDPPEIITQGGIYSYGFEKPSAIQQRWGVSGS